MGMPKTIGQDKRSEVVARCSHAERLTTSTSKMRQQSMRRQLGIPIKKMRRELRLIGAMPTR